MVRHWQEFWGLYVIVAILLLFVGALIRESSGYESRCEARGGLVWQRDGRACLLPPYNRVEM